MPHDARLYWCKLYWESEHNPTGLRYARELKTFLKKIER